MVYEAASTVSRGDDVDFLGVFRASLMSIFPFMVVSLLYGLLVGFGMLLFIVPGIYMAAKYYLAFPILVHERVGPMEAMRRSAALTEGIKWYMLAASFFSVFLSSVFGKIVGFVMQIVCLPLEMFTDPGALVIAPFAVFIMFCLTLAWLGGALIQAVGATTAYRLVHETRG